MVFELVRTFQVSSYCEWCSTQINVWLGMNNAAGQQWELACRLFQGLMPRALRQCGVTHAQQWPRPWSAACASSSPPGTSQRSRLAPHLYLLPCCFHILLYFNQHARAPLKDVCLPVTCRLAELPCNHGWHVSCCHRHGSKQISCSTPLPHTILVALYTPHGEFTQRWCSLHARYIQRVSDIQSQLSIVPA